MVPPSTPIAVADLGLAAVMHRDALMMMGAFTLTESNAAAKRIGIIDNDIGMRVMMDVRLTCIDHIHEYYEKRKEEYINR